MHLPVDSSPSKNASLLVALLLLPTYLMLATSLRGWLVASFGSCSWHPPFAVSFRVSLPRIPSSNRFVRAVGDPLVEYKEPVFQWEKANDAWKLWDFVPLGCEFLLLPSSLTLPAVSYFVRKNLRLTAYAQFETPT